MSHTTFLIFINKKHEKKNNIKIINYLNTLKDTIANVNNYWSQQLFSEFFATTLLSNSFILYLKCQYLEKL